MTRIGRRLQGVLSMSTDPLAIGMREVGIVAG